MAHIQYTGMERERGLEKTVWVIVREGGVILDAVFTDERAAIFLACDGDEVVPYTIKI